MIFDLKFLELQNMTIYILNEREFEDEFIGGKIMTFLLTQNCFFHRKTKINYFYIMIHNR